MIFEDERVKFLNLQPEYLRMDRAPKHTTGPSPIRPIPHPTQLGVSLAYFTPLLRFLPAWQACLGNKSSHKAAFLGAWESFPAFRHLVLNQLREHQQSGLVVEIHQCH
jgi:hypothetical protein